MIQKFLKDESGATAIEYGLMAALVAFVAIPGFGALGVSMGDMYDRVAAIVSAAVP